MFIRDMTKSRNICTYKEIMPRNMHQSSELLNYVLVKMKKQFYILSNKKFSYFDFHLNILPNILQVPIYLKVLCGFVFYSNVIYYIMLSYIYIYIYIYICIYHKHTYIHIYHTSIYFIFIYIYMHIYENNLNICAYTYI